MQKFQSLYLAFYADFMLFFFIFFCHWLLTPLVDKGKVQICRQKVKFQNYMILGKWKKKNPKMQKLGCLVGPLEQVILFCRLGPLFSRDVYWRVHMGSIIFVLWVSYWIFMTLFIAGAYCSEVQAYPHSDSGLVMELLGKMGTSRWTIIHPPRRQDDLSGCYTTK